VVLALAVVWIMFLVLAFVAQTTELFGEHNGTAALVLLAVGAVGFIGIGSAGIVLVIRSFDRER
jgi:hypothetical protein